ncbi:hypothetical protein CTAYLR_005697 [Chrysophaeum taylorii]|uniref:Ankyrin repeat protein n=1 Tax=Chrysophaeum taylorii TaxID=2483200 RepID=A0AAD7UDD6_9STRA|nr:hypothetical protein CTAYLR_005697 [Chrysophaeum taylorii]
MLMMLSVSDVRIALARGHDVNCRDDSGRSLLYVASYGGRADIARVLLDRGADVHATRCDGSSPLFIASREGHVDVARLLLDHGADLNQTTCDGLSPLCAAIFKKVRVAAMPSDVANGGAEYLDRSLLKAHLHAAPIEH